MSNDLIKILEMFKKDTISITEAAELIDAIYSPETQHHSKSGKNIVIEVINKRKSGMPVKIKIPKSFAKISKNFISKKALGDDFTDEDVENLKSGINDLLNNAGEALNIETDNGETVKIYIE